MSILTVGTGQQYATLAAAIGASQDGDILQVQAGTYVNDFATINTKITIEGVGGMVKLVATEPPPDGKAILTTNTDVTIENLEFSGAAVPDANGAGIRYQGGNLVIENSYFHHNEMGLLAASVGGGTITIRNSEFAQNGTSRGLGHNLYVGQITSLTVEDSYFHDAMVGHEIKSRAHNNTIVGNRIYDNDGSASYSIDLPHGGNAVISGNVIQQGPNSQNPGIIHFGGEGAAYESSSLSIADNTVVNDLASSDARLLLNQTGGTATIADNEVYGLTEAQIAYGPATVSGTTTLESRPASDYAHPWEEDATASPASPPGDLPETPNEEPGASDGWEDTVGDDIPVDADPNPTTTPEPTGDAEGPVLEYPTDYSFDEILSLLMAFGHGEEHGTTGSDRGLIKWIVDHLEDDVTTPDTLQHTANQVETWDPWS